MEAVGLLGVEYGLWIHANAVAGIGAGEEGRHILAIVLFTAASAVPYLACIPKPHHCDVFCPNAMVAGVRERAPQRQIELQHGAPPVVRHVGEPFATVHAQTAADEPMLVQRIRSQRADAIGGLNDVRLIGKEASQRR